MFIYMCILLAFSCEDVSTLECDRHARPFSYLDVAVDMIQKAKNDFPTCSDSSYSDSLNAMDCEDMLKSGYNKSGVYTIQPRNRVLDGKKLDVYCDMDTDDGGWTVIQRRGDYGRPNDYFYKDWASYKSGFGDIEKDFWLGNDNIFGLTNQGLYSVRFDLKTVDGSTAFAVYDIFWIDDESYQYTLHIKDYSGNAGDSMEEHNGMKFSTKDSDHDTSEGENCAQRYKSGWWHKACHTANLNGLYLKGKHESFADGVEWQKWKGYHESLLSTEIKIRHKNFRKNPIADDRKALPENHAL